MAEQGQVRRHEDRGGTDRSRGHPAARLKAWFGPLILHSEWQLVLLAAAFGAGAALYIAGPVPAMPVTLAGAVALFGTAVFFMPRLRSSFSLRGLAAFLVGLAFAALRVQSGTPPIVTGETFVQMTAIVERLEVRPDRPSRLLLAPTHFNRHGLSLPPHIRLTVRTQMPATLQPGDEVRLAALLTPPAGPLVPGGYDYAREAYFAGIGAGGYAAGPVELVDARSPSGAGARLQALRLRIAGRLREAVPGQAGALAIALTVGYRNHLSLETAQTLRRTGLSHLLAISGLHMGLVTAAAFFFLEYLFAALPALALRVRPKKLAAGGAWCVALGYLLLSGAGISTIRAFVMVTVALLAVLLDRRVLSLRSVALAALAVMLLWPEAVLAIGFQMSFAATAVLVAFYEYAARRGWFQNTEPSPGVFTRVGRFLRATLMTTLVAQLAVAPFALYHFQSVSAIGVLANLFVVPLVSVAVMPLALVSLCLMPFGLDTLVAPLLKLSLNAVLSLAHLFSDMPLAMVRMGASDAAFLALVAALLVAGLVVRGRWLLLPIGGVAVAFAGAGLLSRQADILIAGEGRVVAARMAQDQTMAIAGGRRDSIRDQRWQQYWGFDPLEDTRHLPRTCDTEACRTILPGGTVVSLIRTQEALHQACGAGDIVILPRRWRGYCRGALLVLTEEELKSRGPAGLSLSDSGAAQGLTLAWSNPETAQPWHPVPKHSRRGWSAARRTVKR